MIVGAVTATALGVSAGGAVDLVSLTHGQRPAGWSRRLGIAAAAAAVATTALAGLVAQLGVSHVGRALSAVVLPIPATAIALLAAFAVLTGRLRDRLLPMVAGVCAIAAASLAILHHKAEGTIVVLALALSVGLAALARAHHDGRVVVTSGGSSGRLLRRLATHDVARFAAVGVVNTTVDLELFNTLHYGARLNPVVAKAISAAIATGGAYVMTRVWAFAHREHRVSVATVVVFTLINVVGFVLGVAAIAIVRYGLQRDDFVSLVIVANGSGIVAGMGWRYWSLRRWVFRAADASVRHEPVAGR